MDTKKIMTRIVLRNDTAAAWEAANPVLLKGEMAAEIDTGLLKIGDGVTAYKSLSYLNEDTVGDNKTIVLDGTTLKLKNFGVEYYKWIPAEGDVAGHHEKQVVDGDHPWIAGLEPRSVENPDGGFEIAWYEPSNITVNGLEKEVTAVSAIAEANKTAIGDEATEGSILNTLTKKLDLAGGTMTGDIVLKDGGKAISDTAVANLIGSAGHLKREIVEQLPEVGAADPDTIYLVKIEGIASGDAYKEYMLIGGELVQIGDTTIDLDPYAKKVVPAAENNIAVLSADGNLVDGGKTIAGVLADVDTKLKDYVAKEDGKSLVSDEQITKLAGLANIKTIGANLTLTDEGVLRGAAPYTLPAATTDDLGGIKVGAGLSITEDGVLAVKAKAENGLSLTNEGLVLTLATKDSAGTVKGSEADNGISIAADGTMSVNRISTSKLFTEEGTTLVLDGGGASE